MPCCIGVLISEVRFMNMCLLAVRIVNPRLAVHPIFPDPIAKLTCAFVGVGVQVWGCVVFCVFKYRVMIKQCKFIRLGGKSE